MSLGQDTRFLSITTALGPNVLAVRSMSVQEQLGALFYIETDLRSESGEIDFDEVVGHNAVLRLDVGQDSTRFFNGFISRLVQVANVAGHAHYRATIVPRLWSLPRPSDCRIFQNKTVPEILSE